MTSFELFSSSRPQEGANITGKEIRDLLKSVACMNAGQVAPLGDAILIGDVRFSRVDIDTVFKLSLSINGVAAEVDLSTTDGTTSAIVGAINTAFSALGTVAYVYNYESYDATAHVALLAPRVVGSVSTITISEVNDGTDISEQVFGLQGRLKGMPYTVTSETPPYGLAWLKQVNGDDDEVSLYMGSPARVTSFLDLSDVSGINLTEVTSLRIKISGPGVYYGPLTIDIRGANPAATTVEEVADAINTAFVAVASPYAWPSPTYGPASIVTRNGSGKYLQLVSGPSDEPYTGPNASIELSGLDIGGTLGFNFLIDDAVTTIFGLARGIEGKKFSRVPHIFRGADFSNNFIRGIGNRSGPGIGMWGPAMETSIDIPPAGNVDGEIRLAKDTGIQWIYREGQNGLSGSGWTRSIPSQEYPISYDKFTEKYRLLSTNDTFVPQPLSRTSTYPLQVDSNNTLTGRVGDAVTLVDGRDFTWLDVKYTDGRTPFDTPAIYDNFPSSDHKLRRTREGCRWFISDANTPSTSPSVAGNATDDRLRPYGGGVVRTSLEGASSFSAIKAYVDGAGITRTETLLEDMSGSGVTSEATFLTPEDRLEPPNNTDLLVYPIRPGSFSVRFIPVIGDPGLPLGSTTLENARAYDNGAGVISGTYISGTIDYTTGAVSLTFGGSVSVTQYKLSYNYCLNGFNIVAVDVRKDPSLEIRGGGTNAATVAEAGVIYSASADLNRGGFAAVVRDDGTGSVISINKTTGVTTTVGNFLVDPPLDDTWRTLRVVYSVVGSDMVHAVFWDGSNKPSDWITKDYTAGGSNLTAAETNGGVEIDRVNKQIAQVTVPLPGDNSDGYYCGIWAKGTIATLGYSEKSVAFRNFQSHGGHRKLFTETIPALPPVSAVRLRDTINAVQVTKDGASASGLITDCTAASPLIVNLTGDLASSSGVVLNGLKPSRTLDLGFDFSELAYTRDPRYLGAPLVVDGNPGALGLFNGSVDRANTSGRIAYWSLSNMLVTGTLNTSPPNSIDADVVAASPLTNSMYLFKPYNDGLGGSIINTPFTGATWNAYWRPYGTMPNPSMIQSTLSTDVSKWNTAPQTGFDIDTDVYTTLPISTGGVNWRYYVVCAEVATRTSYRAQTSGFAGGWNPTAYPILLNPYVRSVTYDSDASAAIGMAVFKVYFVRQGPVAIAGLRLEIVAVRVGTTT